MENRPAFWVLLVFYLSYIWAAGLGQGFAIVPGIAVTYWPPSGIFVAALLLTKRASWPWWIASACLAEFTSNWLWFHNPAGMALIYFGANALEAVIAALLIRRVGAAPFRLDTLDQVVRLIVFGAFAAPVAGATVIALTDHLLGKHSFATTWPLVWLGDGTGLLVSTPLTLVAVQVWQARKHLLTRRAAEAIGLAVALCVLAVLCFQEILPTVYVTMLPLLWISVRFQLRGAAVALGVLVLLAAGFAADGQNELASSQALLQQKIALQTFIGISALAALFVASLAQQNLQALANLRQANAQLEERVAARTAELSEREQQFRHALDAGGALVYTAGLEPESAARVHGLERVTGYDPAKTPLTNQWWWSLIHPDDYPAYQEHAKGFIEKDGGRQFVYRIRHADGSWRHIEQTVEVIRDQDGAARRIVGAIVDISERKEAETALMDAQRFSQGIIDSVASLLYIYDLAEQCHIYDSPQIKAILGYDPKELQAVGAAFLTTLVHPTDQKHVSEMFAKLKAQAGNAPHKSEYRMRHKDGRWIWMADHVTVYERDEEGRAISVLGAAHDIMELKQQEQLKLLLMREVSHRSKNILSLVQAIARQTAQGSAENFLPNFYERLVSLSAAYDLLVHSDWKGITLNELVTSQLGHFKDLLGSRILVEGPPLAVNAAAAQSLAMALHELATNAGKYGALSNARGKIRIAWELATMADGAQAFTISWDERRGPKVRPNEHRGFGSTVIERMSKAALSAEVDYQLAPAGVTWRLTCNASQVLEPSDAQPAARSDGDGNVPSLPETRTLLHRH